MKANFDGVAGLSCQLRFAVAFIVLATATGMPGRLFAQSWAGPYLGVHAGQNRLSTDTHLSNVTPTSNLFLNQALNLGLMPTQFSGERSSFAYGVSAGYNWQFGRFIAGVEADITRSQSRVNHDFKLGDAGFVFFGGPAHMDASMDWLATFRGRAGFLVSDRFFLFGTGGLALAHVNANSRITQPSTLPDCSVATACATLAWAVASAARERAIWSRSLAVSSSTSTWPFFTVSFTSTSTRATVPESSLPTLTERVGCSVPSALTVTLSVARCTGSVT